MIDAVVGDDSFSEILANGLGVPYYSFVSDHYTDKEPFVKVSADYDLDGKNVLVSSRLREGSSSYDIMMYLHDFFRVVGNLSSRKLYNANVDVLMPYFVLGRQDKNPRTDENETVRSRDKGKDVGYEFVLQMFKAAGARRIVTVEPHFNRGDDKYDWNGMEVVSVNVLPSITRYYSGKSTLVLSPDKGAAGLAEKVGDALGIKWDSMNKKRSAAGDAIIESYDAGNDNVLLVDDMVSGGGTVKSSVEKLSAKSVEVCSIHPVLSSVGMGRINELLKGKITDFVGTNTVDSRFSKIDIIPELVEFFK